MMTDIEIKSIAQTYMEKRKVDIVLPGTIGQRKGENVEVIFLNPIALEPDVVVCPEDNRVWVNTKTKEVTWIEQM